MTIWNVVKRKFSQNGFVEILERGFSQSCPLGNFISSSHVPNNEILPILISGKRGIFRPPKQCHFLAIFQPPKKNKNKNTTENAT